MPVPVDEEVESYNQLTQQEKMKRRAPAPFALDPEGSSIKTSERKLSQQEYETQSKDSFLETKTTYQSLKARAEIQRNPFAPPSARDPPPLHLQQEPPFGLDPSTAVVAVGRAGSLPLSDDEFTVESRENFAKARTTYLAQKDNAERATDPFSYKAMTARELKPHAPAPYALDKYDDSNGLKNTGVTCSPRDLGKGHTVVTANSFRVEANDEYKRNHREYVTLKAKNKKATSLISDERKAMERKRLEDIGLLPESVQDIARLGLL